MLRITCLLLAVGAALFHLFSAGVSPFTALVQRPIHLAFMATLGFLGVGARVAAEAAEGGKPSGADDKAWWKPVVNGLLIAAVLVSSLYLVSQHEALVRRAGSPTLMDLAGGLLALVVVLELARRTTGWGLVVVATLALVYGVAGPYLPGFLAHRG